MPNQLQKLANPSARNIGEQKRALVSETFDFIRHGPALKEKALIDDMSPRRPSYNEAG
jgi:hypothetical protein